MRDQNTKASANKSATRDSKNVKDKEAVDTIRKSLNNNGCQ